jgi:choice-of-anchor B domain-containing protein
MFKVIYFTIAFTLIIGESLFSQNLVFQSNLSYGSNVLANIGGYVDTSDNEYALVGTEFGLDIVDVTVPTNPVSKFIIPGPQNNWREVKTYREYAYVTTEGGGGLTIVDLSGLPDTVYYKQYTGDGTIAGQLNSIHALHCDTGMGFLYLYGSSIGDGHSLFFNLSDPWNPTFAGEYIYPSGGNDAYVHDGFVLNDTMYEAHIYGGFFTIVDVRNKLNPVLLGTQQTPTSFTHNTWLSDDHKTLFTTDENSNSYLAAYDISDPANINELSRFQTTPGSGSVVHNTHILNDYAITSWYKDGVIITDVSRPRNPVQVAAYDTYTQGSGSGFSGCWGVYPYLPSGNIVASDINNGLYVLSPTYMRGCYLEGIVSDSITSTLLSGVSVEITSLSLNQSTDLAGEFRMGTVTAGTYSVTFTKAGYMSKTISGVVLTNGVLNQLNVLLTMLPTYSFTGSVTDSLTGLPLNDAEVFLESADLSYTATSDSAGNFTFPAVLPDTYTMFTGKWGYRTHCIAVNLVQGTVLSSSLIPGYYDDFTFDFGWTVNGSSSNAWERGDPVGTYNNNGDEINPEDDVTSDCGTNCFVTDNGGVPFNNHDVDNGNTILSSPVFDATIYQNPVLNYYHRYLDIDGTGTPNDTMIVRLSNGTNTIIINQTGPNDPQNGSWVSNSFPLQGLITLTSTMQFSVEVADNSPGNILEGAIDQFEITGGILAGLSHYPKSEDAIEVFPNPFSNEFEISFRISGKDDFSELVILDVLGKTVCKETLKGSEGIFTCGKSLAPGIYIFRVQNGFSVISQKVIKN